MKRITGGGGNSIWSGKTFASVLVVKATSAGLMENGSEGTKLRTNTNEKEICSVIQAVPGRIFPMPMIPARTTLGSRMSSAESTYKPTTVYLLRVR
jgi:hypothetical protein